jgi:hypothetical protein
MERAEKVKGKCQVTSTGDRGSGNKEKTKLVKCVAQEVFVLYQL